MTGSEIRVADVAVLGGGSAGYACALRAAQLGLDVVLVEADKLGGTCLHNGCIPTKALLHAAEVAEGAREAHRFGVKATLDGIDVPAVHGYKNEVIDGLHRGLTGLLASRNVTVLHGWGRLTPEHDVLVDDAIRVRAAAVVLATGSRTRSLPGFEPGGPVLTSDTALGLGAVPDRALVLGGGVIGCEFAGLWASFGAEVTVVEAAPRLLPAEDEWSSRQLERAFRRRGIGVRTGTAVTALHRRDGSVSLVLADGTIADAEVVLIAVGREPRTSGMGFAEAGLTLERGHVVTDEWLRTGVPGVWAAGDIVAGPQLAHRGFAQGLLIAEQIAGLACTPIDEAGIPRVTYSHPEVASVGLTEEQARQRFTDIDTVVYDLAGNGRSRILRTAGGVKVVRRGGDGPVVGVHLVGDRVGELIGEAQLIYNWQATAADVAALVHAHPTQAEALGEAHLALAGKPLHTHA